MKRIVALEAKQGEVTKYCAMRALGTLSHFGHDGELGVVG
jgi:hypothetical protein